MATNGLRLHGTAAVLEVPCSGPSTDSSDTGFTLTEPILASCESMRLPAFMSHSKDCCAITALQGAEAF